MGGYPQQRALEKAAQADQRRPGEQVREWRKCVQRAGLARQKATAQADLEAARLAGRLGMYYNQSECIFSACLPPPLPDWPRSTAAWTPPHRPFVTGP